MEVRFWAQIERKKVFAFLHKNQISMKGLPFDQTFLHIESLKLPLIVFTGLRSSQTRSDVGIGVRYT
jgi:hypothetical protein